MKPTKHPEREQSGPRLCAGVVAMLKLDDEAMKAYLIGALDPM